jgi:V-type H+-transporting ATPase subunit a
MATIRNRPSMTHEAASGLWRSEDVTLVRMHMQREAAHMTALKLGKEGIVMFQDLNKNASAFQRDFSHEVRRCDDMERRLRFLDEEVKKSDITYLSVDAHDADQDVEMTQLNGLERAIEKADGDVRELTTQFESLVSELNRAREHKEVLARDLLGNMDSIPQSGGLSIMCGVMPLEHVETFQRLVYRATRGNAIVRVEDIEEPFEMPNLVDEVVKSVFVVFFSASRLKDKMRKLAELNGGTIYPYIESREELNTTREELNKRYDTLASTIVQNASVRNATLSAAAEKLAMWKRAVATEKGVYGVLNLLQFSGPTVVAQGWVPVSKLDVLAHALKTAERECGAQVATVVECIATKEMKPTYFNVNKITGTFQGIVDSYGIPRYKEVNPGVFTIVTFPYLFGLMYGDIGHGLLLTVFAALLIMFEKQFLAKPLNEIFAMIFGGRYLLFGMGLFATYVGILYNDMFGMSAEIFSSGYTWPSLEGRKGVITPTRPDGNPSVKPAAPVIFGVDVAWTETENKLEYYNSIKMKCAVIVGIVQMTAGILLSLQNHLYFKDMKQVLFRFIPEITFLTLTFGYMALMIIIKWVTPWENTNLAPSLLETMTNFFLAPGTVAVPLYSGQAAIQVILLLVAFSMVPVLLAVIPYLENKEHVERLKKRELMEHGDDHAALAAGEEDDGGHGGGHGGHGDHFDFGEIMIHQIIHTIEFVLGCVSNTASYLRLWALSLAHAQLSEVFWNFAFLMTVDLDTGSGAYIFVGFAVWLSATLGVLLGMESLSAFLHALRLHWVEFQTKFYSGDGVRFTPFSIDDVLAEIR